MLYTITATLVADDNLAPSVARQYIKIVGKLGETDEEECQADFNVDLGSDVTCELNSKVYVGTVTCIVWRIGGSNGLTLSQVRWLNIVTVLE